MYERVMLSKQSACDRQTGRQADFAAQAHNPRNTVHWSGNSTT